MKRKNIFLGMIAFTIGCGSSFASLLGLEDVYVRAQYGAPNSPVRCINTHRQCDNTNATGTCTIIVPLQINGTATASATGTFKTYKVGCAFVLGGGLHSSYAELESDDQFPIRLATKPITLF